jgi:ubiquinone/menaquinone biosynthesis C-methylase UbiE
MNGLNHLEVKEYWRKRSSSQKELTVGFAGHQNKTLQDNEYKTKIDFIEHYIDKNLATIDFGCGIGRWAYLFNNYLGVDITENLLNIAREKYPDKNFLLTKTPTLPLINYKFSQFFTSTVLQHCDDHLVDKIIKSLHTLKQTDFSIVLYENSSVQLSHVNGRKPEIYKCMFEKYFNLKSFQFDTHTVHNEVHSVTILLV